MAVQTELWLVRHGQTDWNVEGRYQGQMDIPLNSIGITQASALAATFAGLNFDAVYSSDLQRAAQTAFILASLVGRPVLYHHGLREIRHGEWEGQLIANVRQQFPALIAETRTDPIDSRAPGGESGREVAWRMAAAANEIHTVYPGGMVLVVGHGFSLATLICQANGISLNEVYHHIPENTQAVRVHWPPAAAPSTGEHR